MKWIKFLCYLICAFVLSNSAKAQNYDSNPDINSLIYEGIIPVLKQSAITNKMRKVIENTPVRLDASVGLNAYAHAPKPKEQPEIVIGTPLITFIYHHIQGGLGSVILPHVKGYRGNAGMDVIHYQTYLWEFIRENALRIKHGKAPARYPIPIYAYLDITEVAYKEAISQAGMFGLDVNLTGQTEYFEGVAAILAHEYGHVYYGHVHEDKNELTLKEIRKQEWRADQEGILLLAWAFGDPSSAIVVNQIFAIIENPTLPSDHPTQICRVLYTLDATVHFGAVYIKVSEQSRMPKEMLQKLKYSFEQLKISYRNMKAGILVSNVCDDYVVLKY